MLDQVNEDNEGDTPQADTTSKTTRSARSEIAFPYGSMEDAFSVVRTLADLGGELTRDQLSAKMGLPGSTFNVRLGAARMFLLIHVSRDGIVGLTKDGRRIVSNDVNEAEIARRDAFLNVALYRRTYEAYEGRNLPEASDLENHFTRLGVAPKQSDKARWAFERSAQYAGFFHAGRNRLVKPIIVTPSDERVSESSIGETSEKLMGKPLSNAAEQSLIRGLLERLPIEGEWSIDGRVRWLKALAVNLGVIYGPNDDVEIEIRAPSKPPTAVAVTLKPPIPRPSTQPPPPASADTTLDDEIPF